MHLLPIVLNLVLFARSAVISVPPMKSYLVVGDWGSGASEQKQVASVMNNVAIASNSQWVVALGDNFYWSGVANTSDPKWKSYWKNVYTGKLAQIPWYAVLGNHDWYGNPTAQTQYHAVDSIWNMPDHFYTKTTTVGSANIAFIFIDTDLMFYPVTGQIDFSKKGWTAATLESQFTWIENQLKLFSNYNYIFVAGHHNAVLCGSPRAMPRLIALMEKYKVNAYMFGHAHALGYNFVNGVSYVLSGAGGKAFSDPCNNSTWGLANFGFTNLIVSESNYVFEWWTLDGAKVHTETRLPRK